ncbi:MAG: DUF1080 domain-containing protein [Planctomycetia bacterium]|nr:DUF1080 domain-containing protein [Planctomycetia bacterium]
MMSTIFFLLIICFFAFSALGVSLWISLMYGGESVSLFNGKNLEGWKAKNCTAEVVNGCLHIKSGVGMLITEKQYGDYILEMEWKALNKDVWDSGIYFRCIPENEKSWPDKYLIWIKKGQEGSLAGIPSTVTAYCKEHEWNYFKLSVKGNTAVMEINGQHAWRFDRLEIMEGFISLRANVPSGGQFMFKNIQIYTLN